MPFDPSYPPTGAEIQSAPLRDQFTGLKELIDAILTIVAAQIDSVSTLDPSQAATVSVSVNGQTLHFSFGIPRGPDGTPGAPGSVINSAQVDSVSSVGSADPASASVSYDGSILHFSFAIPRGIDGANGAPGEVTTATLNAAIAGTSANTNGVAQLGATADSTYNPSQMQDVMNKLDEFIAAARRV